MDKSEIMERNYGFQALANSNKPVSALESTGNFYLDCGTHFASIKV